MAEYWIRVPVALLDERFPLALPSSLALALSY